MTNINQIIKSFVDFAKNKDPDRAKDAWYVGVTNNTERRKGEHIRDLEKIEKGLTHFVSKNVGTSENALKIEKALSAKFGFAKTKKELLKDSTLGHRLIKSQPDTD